MQNLKPKLHLSQLGYNQIGIEVALESEWKTNAKMNTHYH